jgi:hypothetical protein
MRAKRKIGPRLIVNLRTMLGCGPKFTLYCEPFRLIIERGPLGVLWNHHVHPASTDDVMPRILAVFLDAVSVAMVPCTARFTV